MSTVSSVIHISEFVLLEQICSIFLVYINNNRYNFYSIFYFQSLCPLTASMFGKHTSPPDPPSFIPQRSEVTDHAGRRPCGRSCDRWEVICLIKADLLPAPGPSAGPLLLVSVRQRGDNISHSERRSKDSSFTDLDDAFGLRHKTRICWRHIWTIPEDSTFSRLKLISSCLC